MAEKIVWDAIFSICTLCYILRMVQVFDKEVLKLPKEKIPQIYPDMEEEGGYT